MKYLELKRKQQKEYGEFPIFFAYNNQQFVEGLKKLNAEKKDIVSVMGGGFIRRNDAEKLESMLTRFCAEMDELLKDKEALIEALLYEMANHEYSYNWDVNYAVQALGLDRNNEYHEACINEAIKRHRNYNCE